MTYTNSFWGSLINNSKRRLWVWALSAVSMLLVFPAALTLNFTGTDKYMAYGNYATEAAYRFALEEDVCDMLTALPGFVSVVLGLVIGIQGFSYLFSRRKVDMYNSVPVSMKRRYMTVYLNGVIIYLATLLVSVSAVMIMILAKGICSGTLMMRLWLGVAMNVLLFLAAYNISILAACLTGTLFTAVIFAGVIFFYADTWALIIDGYMTDFFRTRCLNYTDALTAPSPVVLFVKAVSTIADGTADFGAIAPVLGSSCWKLLIWIAAAGLFAYGNYRKRPAEAAGRSVAFYSSRVLIKLLVTVPGALMLGMWVYYLSEHNDALMAVGLVAGTILIGLLTEMVFNREFLSAFRRWGGIIVSLLIVMGVYFLFRLDPAGYDSYIPDSADIESFALINEYEGYYSDAIDFEKYSVDRNDSISAYEYAKENMFLRDTDAITELAARGIELMKENSDMGSVQGVVPLDIYYRLSSGSTVSRVVWVDADDKDNDDLLNRLIGPAYYKDGIWQAMTVDIPEEKMVSDITFYENNRQLTLPAADAQEIVDLWREDMSSYDYDRVRYDDERGYISITFTDYNCWNIPVYDCFSGIMGYLKETVDYTPADLPAEAVESAVISIPDENGDYTDYTFEDSSSIEEIMDAAETVASHSGWQPDEDEAGDWSLLLNLTAEYIKSYNSFGLYSYVIPAEKEDKLRSELELP